jgi:site-specific DNA-methyltransferase (adenine-specific)
MIELNQLYRMDCMDGMALFPDKYFDLAVVDPPYGISGSGKKAKHTFCGAGKLKNRTLNECGKKVESWDIAPPKSYFDELYRISKNQIIWGGNYFNLPPSRCWICWDKVQPWNNFSAIELAWTNFDYPAAIYRERATSAIPDGERIHLTQKSVKLYQWILNKYAKEGFTVIDTHAGSASSLIACHKLGFTYIGFEIDEEYHSKAAVRLESEKLQLSLFGGYS